MPNRLEPLNLDDFTGGLNLRRGPFQLRPNESPEMENITIDPLGGIYTRKGWERWNFDDIVDPDVDTWDPRRAFLHQLSDGTDVVYIASDNKIYWADNDAVFAQLAGVDCVADPHLADFVAWGDYVYIACGLTEDSQRRNGVGAVTAMTPLTAAVYNNDYTTPGAEGTVVPRAEIIEAHSGYLFAANLVDDGVTYGNRIRWSHPTSPTDWAESDFIDVDVGGSKITGLMSYEDHLLIFKSDGIWALYGYDLDSWQLVQKSSTIGAISPQAITRSEEVVFFASVTDRGGVYAYGGERPAEVSEQLRYAFETLITPSLIWVGWLDRKLWVTLPWTIDEGPTLEVAAVFVFDPAVGERGAWMYYTSAEGTLGPLVGGSNATTEYPMGVLRNTFSPCVVRLDALDHAADRISELSVAAALGTVEDGFLVTGLDEEIIMSEMPGDIAFPTYYRTPWITAGWPTRKKSWRRPDFICRDTGADHELQVRSFRDYEESSAKRSYRVFVDAGAAEVRWGEFTWGDGSVWGAGDRKGGMIRRGSSFGMCRAIQLRIDGATSGASWGIDTVVMKLILRRFR